MQWLPTSSQQKSIPSCLLVLLLGNLCMWSLDPSPGAWGNRRLSGLFTDQLKTEEDELCFSMIMQVGAADCGIFALTFSCGVATAMVLYRTVHWLGENENASY